MFMMVILPCVTAGFLVASAIIGCVLVTEEMKEKDGKIPLASVPPHPSIPVGEEQGGSKECRKRLERDECKDD